jgi:diguanylate cyclase (GGDEF)-like protein
LAAGVLLLPRDLVLVTAVVLFAPRCLRARRAPWTALAFEGAIEILAVVAASFAASVALAAAAPYLDKPGACSVAALVDCLVLIAAMRLPRLVLTRLQPSDSLEWVVSPLSAGTQLLLAALGAGVAVALLVSPWLLPFALAPLMLVQRSFRIPWLEQQAHLDAKTGLFNARYFELAVERELDRARVLQEPLSVLVADLDLLRDINNAHGHLAGDAVLKGVGEILQRSVRPGDVPSRFGGEEFAVLLPSTDHARAIEIAERLRSTVARTNFGKDAAGSDLWGTISVGVASYPAHGTTTLELMHMADLAVYGAKLQGRNRVLGATAERFLNTQRLGPKLVEAGDDLTLRLAEPAAGESSPAEPPPVARRQLPRSPIVSGAALCAIATGGALVAMVAVGAAHAPLVAVGAAVLAIPALVVFRRRASAVASATAAAEASQQAERLWQAADSLHTQNRSLERANRLLRERSAAAMETLSAAIDARDSHTAGHSRRVQRLAVAIGRELGLSVAELDVLSHAARFHDVGKLAVPEAILLKPGTLDGDEWHVIRRHPDEGARLIENLGFLTDALPAIRHHHERFDGSGYPDGLRGEEIPLGARIIHIADAVDAMLTARVYRPAREPAEVLAELTAHAGTQFCPRCIEALNRVMVAELARGTEVPLGLLVH